MGEELPYEAHSLGSLMAHVKLPEGMKIAVQLARIDQEWAHIVGPQLARRSRPVSFDRTGLVVICDSCGAANLMNLSKASIVRRLKKEFAFLVHDIRVVISRLNQIHDLSADIHFEPQTETVKEAFSVPETVLDEALEEVKKNTDNDKLAMAIARCIAVAKVRSQRHNENARKSR